MGLLQYRGAFADDFDATDASDVLSFERRCIAQDAEIFRSAFAPGAELPRVQMPPKRNMDFAPIEALDDQDIFESAFKDRS